jgi:hypothetical protein
MIRAAAARRRLLSSSSSTGIPAAAIGSDKWRTAAARDLKESKGMTIENLVWESPEGIPVKPIYVQDDIKDLTLPYVLVSRAPQSLTRPTSDHLQDFTLTLAVLAPPCTR